MRARSSPGSSHYFGESRRRASARRPGPADRLPWPLEAASDTHEHLSKEAPVVSYAIRYNEVVGEFVGKSLKHFDGLTVGIHCFLHTLSALYASCRESGDWNQLIADKTCFRGIRWRASGICRVLGRTIPQPLAFFGRSEVCCPDTRDRARTLVDTSGLGGIRLRGSEVPRWPDGELSRPPRVAHAGKSPECVPFDLPKCVTVVRLHGNLLQHVVGLSIGGH